MPDPSPLGTIQGIGGFIPATPADSPAMIDTIFSQVIGFLTITAGLAFLIYFIIGAISWVTAGGDAKKVDTAKSFLTNGAIGMIVIVAAYSIIWIVGEVIGLDILNPGDTFKNIIDPNSPSSTSNTNSLPYSNVRPIINQNHTPQ